MTPDSLLK
jgi:hypothetical protein